MHKRANGRALLRELASIQAVGGVSFGDLCYFKSNSHLNVVRPPPACGNCVCTSWLLLKVDALKHSVDSSLLIANYKLRHRHAHLFTPTCSSRAQINWFWEAALLLLTHFLLCVCVASDPWLSLGVYSHIKRSPCINTPSGKPSKSTFRSIFLWV